MSTLFSVTLVLLPCTSASVTTLSTCQHSSQSHWYCCCVPLSPLCGHVNTLVSHTGTAAVYLCLCHHSVNMSTLFTVTLVLLQCMSASVTTLSTCQHSSQSHWYCCSVCLPLSPLCQHVNTLHSDTGIAAVYLCLCQHVNTLLSDTGTAAVYLCLCHHSVNMSTLFTVTLVLLLCTSASVNMSTLFSVTLVLLLCTSASVTTLSTCQHSSQSHWYCCCVPLPLSTCQHSSQSHWYCCCVPLSLLCQHVNTLHSDIGTAAVYLCLCHHCVDMSTLFTVTLVLLQCMSASLCCLSLYFCVHTHTHTHTRAHTHTHTPMCTCDR